MIASAIVLAVVEDRLERCEQGLSHVVALRHEERELIDACPLLLGLDQVAVAALIARLQIDRRRLGRARVVRTVGVDCEESRVRVLETDELRQLEPFLDAPLAIALQLALCDGSGDTRDAGTAQRLGIAQLVFPLGEVHV